ncbi:Hypothetical predicted protein, partial [Mytilus galloprovincialis]
EQSFTEVDCFKETSQRKDVQEQPVTFSESNEENPLAKGDYCKESLQGKDVKEQPVTISSAKKEQSFTEVDCFKETSQRKDVQEQPVTFSESNVSTNVKQRCKNCGHIIHQDQMFCDKCGNKLGAVCLGEIHGKQCSKFISVESKFCAHCGTANIENNSEKERAPLKKSCNNCGNVIHKHQKFCNNCGHKIGAPCIGKIKGSPCSAFLNVEIKFCENCGMENPDYIAVQHKVNVQCGGPDNVLPPNESVITLTSMGFTREQAIHALKKNENNVEEAIHKILGIPIYENRRTRRKFNISTTQLMSQNEDRNSYIPSDDSIIQLTSMGYTRIEALYALKCCGGRIEKAVDWLLNLPIDEGTMSRTERAFYEGILNTGRHIEQYSDR